MAHPRANKAIASARVKNDAVDAKTLAQLLRTGLLPESWIAPPETREARRLVRMRTAMVRIRSRLNNQIHALLAHHGLHPEGSDIFAHDLTRMTKQLPAVTKQRAEANLRLIEELDKEVDLADSHIHKLFARDEGVRRLLPIPGVGTITAAIVVAEVGEIARFPTARQFSSWCGSNSHRTLERRQHSPWSHLQARLASVALGLGGGSLSRLSEPRAVLLRSRHRQSSRRQDRPRRFGAPHRHALLPRLAQPPRLPGFSGSHPMTVPTARSERTRLSSWPPVTAAF
jgi:hypothetical protein